MPITLKLSFPKPNRFVLAIHDNKPRRNDQCLFWTQSLHSIRAPTPARASICWKTTPIWTPVVWEKCVKEPNQARKEGDIETNSTNSRNRLECVCPHCESDV
ncbi:hypothetical protein RRG08_019928 [Elysia crispata]|uniref:Uncharacterized protein n=1 Tax=Elysia crispata TaxID=231223 RepID=A0AAE1B7U1_9GAST|nr:hypothetical protein RRG08_019928 [Elysia crispata]